MKMGAKIDRKSMKSRGCVANAILMRSGGRNAKKEHFFGSPFCNRFRLTILKNVNKKSIRSSGTVPERSKNAKKKMRGSENRLFFGWFFHWKWQIFGGHFQWQNHPKIHADFEPEKVKLFDEKSMQKLLEFWHLFFICWFVFEKCLRQNTVLKPMIFQCF